MSRDELTEQLQEARAENARMRAALEFYAAPDNWELYDLTGWGLSSACGADDGERARAALGPEQPKET